MKWLASLGTLLALGVSCSTLMAREFTSADGSKKIEAEVIHYSTHSKMVTLRMGDGRRLTTPASNFSEEDRDFLKEMVMAEATKDAIEVDLRTRPKDKSLENDGHRRISIEKRFFENAIVVQNKSEFTIKGLSLRYWVVLRKYTDAGEEFMDIKDGTEKVGDLEPEDKKEIEIIGVTLIQGAVSNCKPDCRDCNRAAQNAASVNRERVFGHKVEVLDADGKVVATDCSSSRVEDLLGNK